MHSSLVNSGVVNPRVVISVVCVCVCLCGANDLSGFFPLSDCVFLLPAPVQLCASVYLTA